MQRFYLQAIIQPGQVTGTLVDFTSVLSFTDSRLKTIANGGHVVNGNDIRPYSDFGVAMPYLLISYDGSAGTVLMKAKVPLAYVGRMIYLGYGDVNLAADESSPSAWDANFKGAWGFKDPASLILTDSTIQGNTLTNNNAVAATTGVIDGGASFAAGADRSLTATAPAVQAFGDCTFEVWINPASFFANAGEYTGLMTYGKAADVIFSLSLNDDPGSGTQCTPIFEVQNSVASYQSVTAAPLVVSTLYYLAAVRSGANLLLYRNGVPTSAAFVGTPRTGDATYSLGIGRDFFNSSAQRFYKGMLDEARMSDVGRSPEWIGATYKNVSAPGSFWALGSEIPILNSPLALQQRVV